MLSRRIVFFVIHNDEPEDGRFLKMSIHHRLSLCAIVALTAAPAAADIIHFTADQSNSTENTGVSFDGSVAYDFLSGTSGLLTVSLTNTTDPSIGGFLTGFVFNINSADPNASAVLDSTLNPNFVGMQNVSGSPFGNFDAGAAVSGSFEGGGSPSDGIAIGDTGVFSFLLTASDASALSAISFLTGPNEFNFITRFRGVGLDGEDSDKVPVTVLPTPGALAILLAAGLIGTRRRRSTTA